VTAEYEEIEKRREISEEDIPLVRGQYVQVHRGEKGEEVEDNQGDGEECRDDLGEEHLRPDGFAPQPGGRLHEPGSREDEG